MVSSGVVLVALMALMTVSCAPPSGQPTRKFKLDNFCTLEVRNVQGSGSAYVAARKAGIEWVDGTITGGPPEGCEAWVLTEIDAHTTQGTNRCIFWVPDGVPGPSPGPGC